MSLYPAFLTMMSGLFALAATVLLIMTVIQAIKGRGQRAAVYLGLTLLAGVVAAGFYFFRGLF